ncbi:alpha/beta hydrolase [Massilia cavernae]|uniref:Alpha/beta hydrolase n=1 Tax=Massilia cavernae TaxID=2320864 RepID=A0A418XQZ2_9BURK|nr:alpha/beta hydrolase [Massilia cavernae]RJG14875.1 alpha/beta hydrolase [Massilia cavernae]
MGSPTSPFHVEKTVSFTCALDPRFSFCLYVPRDYHSNPPGRILVAVHGTDRNNQYLRDLFSEYAQQTNTVVLAPLFPVGVEDDDLDNYKYLNNDGIRYDRILLAMVEQVAAAYKLNADRFALFGFSGGAHLAHRFFYVHPERLSAVIVAAPGSVTLPSLAYPWWVGLYDYEQLFGRPVPWAALHEVPVHLVVGGDDINTAGIVQGRDNRRWMEGVDSAGANRLERIRSLHRDLARNHIHATLEELDGVAHQLEPVVQAAITFLRRPSTFVD